MNFAISDLRQRPEFFGVVADRIWQAWWESRGVALSEIRERLTDNMTDAPLPLALVAHEADQFLGTASLIASDLDARPHLSPWVAAVWTEPAARKQGVGRALVNRACAAGFALDHDHVYLCAAPALWAYYASLGWTPVEGGVGPREMTVFARHRPT